ncbi:hypothetical protein HQ571_02690 [Candidatus Kuenenbacteria bacterium]|nr:hypothetical protein [Candidatus Kuenenbacteria bacterium]
MKVEYLLYLTPVEELMFNFLFNGIEKVELDGVRKVRRIGLANGKLKALLREVGKSVAGSDVDANDVLCDFIERLIANGIIKRVGERCDSESIGVLETSVTKESIVCISIPERSVRAVSQKGRKLIEIAQSRVQAIENLLGFVRENIDGSHFEAKKWRRRLDSVYNLVHNAGAAGASRWLVAAKGFEKYEFDSGAEPAPPAAKPEGKQEIRRNFDEFVALLDKIMQEKSVDATKAKVQIKEVTVAFEKERQLLTEAIGRCEDFDNSEYRSLLAEKQRLKAVLAEGTALPDAYALVIADLKTVVFPAAEEVSPAEPPLPPPPAAAKPNVVARKDRKANGSMANLVILDRYKHAKIPQKLVLLVAISKLKDEWFAPVHVFELSKEIDPEMTVRRIATAVSSEIRRPEKTALFTFKIANDQDKEGLGLKKSTKYLYRLSAAGLALAREVISFQL